MLDKPVVLVVEDEPLILLHVQLALEDGGFDVLTARDSDMARSHLAERPDISAVLTDVGIPGPVNGLTLAKEVTNSRPGVPVFVTSGAGEETDMALPDSAQFVRKPYTAAQMCALIHRRAGAH